MRAFWRYNSTYQCGTACSVSFRFYDLAPPTSCYCWLWEFKNCKVTEASKGTVRVPSVLKIGQIQTLKWWTQGKRDNKRARVRIACWSHLNYSPSLRRKLVLKASGINLRLYLTTGWNSRHIEFDTHIYRFPGDSIMIVFEFSIKGVAWNYWMQTKCKH
jgi:hypothetical protein